MNSIRDSKCCLQVRSANPFNQMLENGACDFLADEFWDTVRLVVVNPLITLNAFEFIPIMGIFHYFDFQIKALHVWI